MSKYVKQSLLVILLITVISNSVSIAADDDFKDKLKALYITRLADFLIWPGATKTSTFKICIESTDKVAIQLKNIEFDHILDRQVEIIDPPSGLSLIKCDFLYISVGKVDSLWADFPIFTLSSQAGFAEQGGMIEFYIDQGKVRMKTNLYAVNQTGIKVSSKLIRLLKIVTPLGVDKW
ncbi:MAG: YfiR family protein [Methylococcaceae bacterium]